MPIKHTALNQSGLSLEARAWLRSLSRSPETRFAWRHWRYLTGRLKAPPAPPAGTSKQRADDIRTAVVLSIGRSYTIKPAPAIFRGWQERGRGKSPIALYNLTRGIPGHPKGSTVSDATLRAAGFTPPPPPKNNPRRKVRRKRRARKNWPCPGETESNPPRARAVGGRKRNLIYSSYVLTHGTTGKGIHVTGGRYEHKSRRRKVAIYRLPRRGVALYPLDGAELWGY